MSDDDTTSGDMNRHSLGENQPDIGLGKMNSSPNGAIAGDLSTEDENLVRSLLKEKRSVHAQNDQLWRLVDKQRAMILALQEDVEKALKSKQKYKQRYLEVMERYTEMSQVHESLSLSTMSGHDASVVSTPVEPSGGDPMSAVSITPVAPNIPTTPSRNPSRALSPTLDAESPIYQAIRTEIERNHPDRNPPSLPLENSPMPVMGSFPRSPGIRRSLLAEEVGKRVSGNTSPPNMAKDESYTATSNGHNEMGYGGTVKSMEPIHNQTVLEEVVVEGHDDAFGIIGSQDHATGDLLSQQHYQGVPTPSRNDEAEQLMLNPSEVSSIDVRVVSSRSRSSKGKRQDDYSVILGIFRRKDGSESWRIEKDYQAINALDKKFNTRLKELYNVKVPERSVFQGHAPSKSDLRRVVVDEYFRALLHDLIDEISSYSLCLFLSTNIAEIAVDAGGTVKKQGFLTKRGKNFGGWKSRYFVLEGILLKYFESPAGSQLGEISLGQCTIGRQAQTEASKNDTDAYRHAFLILEPRKNAPQQTRHILCAESDETRDEWVQALLEHVHPPEASMARSAPAPPPNPPVPRNRDTTDNLYSLPGGSVTHTELESYPQDVRYRTPSPSQPSVNGESSARSNVSPALFSKAISGPLSGAPIHDPSVWGHNNDEPPRLGDKKSKKKTFWGFSSNKTRSASDLAQHLENAVPTPQAAETQPSQPPVFGAHLDEAVTLSQPEGVFLELPAVVFRCIEYLELRQDHLEEGIMRLSGSNNVIKKLRKRFNEEYDVNLVGDEEQYDVHAVAGLLKLYLRELPVNVLTRELHNEFSRAIADHEKESRTELLRDLVHRLPNANYTLLFVLSAHLLRIVENAEINKMTIRNVGIVFSPTLSIPAGVFSSFLSDFQLIFDSPPLSVGNAYVEEETQEVDEATVRHNLSDPEDKTTSGLSNPSQDMQTLAQGRHEDVDLGSYAQADDGFL